MRTRREAAGRAVPPTARAIEHRLVLALVRSGLLGSLVLLASCVTPNLGTPLNRWDPDIDARWVEQIPDERSDELFVLLALSGGGTRAAAFAYGVFQELSQTEIEIDGRRHRLLDEVDVISSVSGGSFPAAYYGLFGDRIFEDFESRFLRKDIEGELLERLLWPPNWLRLASGEFGRSDLAAEYYDEYLFDHTTFRSMFRPAAPLVVINATDLATGSQFGFVQRYFDLLCSDLDAYPVSRAVAASSAVPLILSPITLQNHARQCSYSPPEWLEQAEIDRQDPRRRAEARSLLSYLDPTKERYVHLVDGGIADNLGLRAAFKLFSLQDNVQETFRYIGHPHPRLILFILVNAQSHRPPTFALSAASPTLAELIGVVTGDAISHYSFETIELVDSAFKGWATDLSSRKDPVRFLFVEVSFEAVNDPAERELLNQIGTNFSLNDEEVDRLIQAGRSVLRASPQYLEAVQAFNGRIGFPAKTGTHSLTGLTDRGEHR